MTSKTILVGVTGGVAAYKAVDVVSALRKQGHTVQVVLTKAASKFVAPATFAAVSGLPVLTTLWPDVGQGSLEDHYPHLYPATRADLFLLLPATADSMAKIAHGFGSNLLTTCCLSLPSGCKRVFCPSMNVEMWRNPVVQANVERLEQQGWTRMGPDSGHLACGMTGEGRLRAPEAILSGLTDLLNDNGPLSGKTVLILSGPTREHLDPIRFIGNPSSGLMGQALAEEAVARGAKVQFITGPVPDDHLPSGGTIAVHRVTGALEMLEAARSVLAEADAVLYVAAVADYRPESVQNQKLPKQSDPFELKLMPNPDLAATLNAEKRPETFTIGFALQTREGHDKAREKLSAKHLDGIVLNYADSMGSATGQFSYLGAGSSDFADWGRLDKREAARNIISQLPTGDASPHE